MLKRLLKNPLVLLANLLIIVGTTSSMGAKSLFYFHQPTPPEI